MLELDRETLAGHGRLYMFPLERFFSRVQKPSHHLSTPAPNLVTNTMNLNLFTLHLTWGWSIPRGGADQFIVSAE